MPVYEFECSKKHITEQLVSIGTQSTVCAACVAEMKILHLQWPNSVGSWNAAARRILSPTPTTFRFADKRKYSID